MIIGKNLTHTLTGKLKQEWEEANAHYLLGYNEPDYGNGHNHPHMMSPLQAAEACPPPARSAPPAQYNLGLLLDKGRHGGLPDPEAAVRWWRRAADQGHAPALHCLALRFMQLPPAARRPGRHHATTDCYA